MSMQKVGSISRAALGSSLATTAETDRQLESGGEEDVGKRALLILAPAGDDRLLRFVFCFMYKFVLLDFSSRVGSVRRCEQVWGGEGHSSTHAGTLCSKRPSRRPAPCPLGTGGRGRRRPHTAPCRSAGDGAEGSRRREREGGKGRENTQLEG